MIDRSRLIQMPIDYDARVNASPLPLRKEHIMSTRTVTHLFVTLALAFGALLFVDHHLARGARTVPSHGTSICVGAIQACIDAASAGETIVMATEQR